MIRRPRKSTLFPYTPLSRSRHPAGRGTPAPDRRTATATGQRDPGAAPPASAAHLPAFLVRLGADLDAQVLSPADDPGHRLRSEEHTSELQSQSNLVCRLLLE